MLEYLIYIVIGLVVISFLLYNFAFMDKIGKKSKEDMAMTKEYGIKPMGRHPQIDPNLCIACGSCIRACPETHGDDSPLGIVNGQVLLVNPLKCVGHAACEMECPTGALTVSLGELADDPNMPVLDDNNETVVKGIFIAGELSGVPLVKNAIEQGKKVIETVKERISSGKYPEKEGLFDVLIVGIGPAGLSATAAAHEQGLTYLTIEQGSIGGTVANFPKQKMVMTSPVHIPLYGVLKKTEIQKEELLAIWHEIIETNKLGIHVGEKVEQVEPAKELFHVRTNKGEYYSKTVVLSLGRRGTPRKLGIEGEALNKVTYGLVDPGEYTGKNIIVIGGGDSAIEAALALSKENQVTLSYRKEQFFRIKKKNAGYIESAINDKTVSVMFNSQVKKITEDKAYIDHEKEQMVIDNDFVLILAGGEPPFPMLRGIGVIPGEDVSN